MSEAPDTSERPRAPKLKFVRRPPLTIKFPSAALKTSANQAAPGSSPQPPATKPKPQRKSKVKKEKPVRISNPTPKKRALEESTLSDADDDVQAVEPPPKKPKIVLKTKGLTGAPSASAPFSAAPLSSGIRRIILKGVKGKKLKEIRPEGVGYDSEASDQEDDPAIEEDFILRMLPGEDCQYLRQAVTEQQFGPLSQGGALVRIRFLRTDGRRAVVSINGTSYAAAMVDLPCIVEGMKSWNKRDWYKSVDICQMLLVLGPVKNDDEALDYPLPKRVLDHKTMQYAHGLTPPMHNVRKKRFRPQIHRAAVEDVEQEVERLLSDDKKAQSSKWSFVDVLQLERERAQRMESAEFQGDMEEYGDEDAEGEIFGDEEYGVLGMDTEVAVEEDPEDSLAAELEAELMQEEADAEMETAPTLTIPAESNAPSPGSFAVETPIVAESPAATPSKGATSGDEEETSDDDEESAEEMDEDAAERQQELMRQREAIEDLQAAVKAQEAALESQQNPIFKKKISSRIQGLKADLESKIAALGEGAEE